MELVPWSFSNMVCFTGLAIPFESRIIGRCPSFCDLRSGSEMVEIVESRFCRAKPDKYIKFRFLPSIETSTISFQQGSYAIVGGRELSASTHRCLLQSFPWRARSWNSMSSTWRLVAFDCPNPLEWALLCHNTDLIKTYNAGSIATSLSTFPSRPAPPAHTTQDASDENEIVVESAGMVRRTSNAEAGEGTTRFLANFSDLLNFVIPQPELCGHLITKATRTAKICGCPVRYVTYPLVFQQRLSACSKIVHKNRGWSQVS